jgi:hypothetical protein
MVLASTTNDLAKIYRSQFSVFEHVTYVNSCSQGALANSVKKSFDDYIETLELKGSAWGDWAGYQEKMRSLFATFFKAEIIGNPKEIFGTKTPSITSTWNQSALLEFTNSKSRSRFPKSHDKIEGETITDILLFFRFQLNSLLRNSCFLIL